MSAIMVPQQHVVYNKRVSDRMAYYGRASKIIGGVHIVAGLLSMALGVGAICTMSSAYDVGYGIWCGFVFSLTGILSICTNYHKNVCMITTTMIFCILSAFCGIIQFCLGVTAAPNDRLRSQTGELSREKYYLDYDIYYKRNDPFHYLYSRYCTETYGAFTWESAWGPVDVLLLLVGFLEMLVAVVSAILCCHSICCGLRRVYHLQKGVYVSDQEQNGAFYNNAYTYRSNYAPSVVMSEPTILKVVEN